MTEKRIQFNNIVQNQLPAYVREEFPLVAEFLKQYYISQEFQSSPTDIIQNIDSYIKLDEIKNNTDSIILGDSISFSDDTITTSSPSGTVGFPDSYGLLQIDNEIITYTGKTQTSFIGCIRGFSGVTSYQTTNKPDQLVFETSLASEHAVGAEIINLSSLFLKEFFNKIKYQISPGFENREFYSNLDKYLFLKQSKDFYSTRGTDLSFKILFNVLYGEDVRIIKPKEQLIRPSDAQYLITNDLVVEAIEGDPYKLENSTLFQDEYGSISKTYAPVSNVEKIVDISGKVFYKLSFDSGYNKDITFEGSLYGNFSVHPNTKNIGTISSGSDTIVVDSTVGFPSKGELSVKYADGTEGIVSYTSKNINQFFGCKNIVKTINDASSIWLNIFARNNDSTIKLRITSVLKDLEVLDKTFYQQKDDKCIIKTIGTNENNTVADSLILNNTFIVDVESIQKISSTKYKITTKLEHNLRLGDSFVLRSSNDSSFNCTVSRINSSLIIDADCSENIPSNLFYRLQRNLSKFNSEKYNYISNHLSDVQNVYHDQEKTLIASSSLPSYGVQVNPFDRTITFTGTFVGETFTIPNHGFYSGESVYYTSKNGSLFENGIYFIKRVDSNNIKFAKSRANLYNSIFINLTESVSVIDSKIQDIELYNKQLDSQKLFREISGLTNDGGEYITDPGLTGILINGVEILNYKSKDQIYYGDLQEINVVNTGSDYDIINPPQLTISDSVGTGATGYCSVIGSLNELRIVDPGFDYIGTPKIVISGGNGLQAKANALMTLVDHRVSFNSEQQSQFVNIANNTIGFSTYHKFRNFEKVIYKTEGQKSVGGISTNSQYYISIVDSLTVKLHSNLNDAVSGINTISLTSFGIGNHILEAYNKKSIISSINIENPGSGYENKKRTVTSAGISTSLGIISIKNHDYKSGEVVTYSTTGVSIDGLVSGSRYYVTKIDTNNFRLSRVGVGTDNQDFYYKTKQFISFGTKGSGIHSFNYPQITVDIVGNLGISSEFSAKVQPIFRGQISSVHLENGGVGYGSSEIINFNREPLVTAGSGSNCQLTPIINDGKIVDILIQNPGSGYNSPPNLSIIANNGGVGAVLTPILESGQIKSVKIIQGGFGYDPNNTSIVVTSAGSGVEFKTRIKSWTINLFQKYFNNILDDDGFIYYNSRSKYGLQYTHIYAPRKLRENIYPKDFSGKTLYSFSDLTKDTNGFEVSSTSHSPIIGWAYDGNPIYGPYGYSKKDGGLVTQMKSGYTLNQESDRPPYPQGFFVEDYEYQYSNEDDVLDENNGRFCVTPDFPKGTYAYFATFDLSPSGNFAGYKLPSFPYLIGNKFKSKPNQFNYLRSSNQDDIDLNQTDWIRNTKKYGLENGNLNYPYIFSPNSLNQTIDIKFASPGSVENIGILTGGFNYKVNDRILFGEEGTKGFGFTSKVSRVAGKDVNFISSATTSISNVSIYPSEGSKGLFVVESTNPHELSNKDIINISGINTTTSLLNGSYEIDVNSKTLSISNPSGINSVSVTGVVTYFSVFGGLQFSNIKENDIFEIGSEKIKVLNIDTVSSRIRVLRSIDGTVGTSHSYSDVLYEQPRRFNIRSGISTSFISNRNKEIYFDPKESVSLGVGIGTTITFSNPGAGITQIFVPSRSIYIPNHNLETGDKILYSNNGGSSLQVSSDGVTSSALSDQSLVYVAKISNDLIGISSVMIGIGSTGTFVGIASTTSNIGTLYFTGIGTGSYHSFTTNYQSITAKVSKNTVTVSTAQTHGLLNGDSVYVSVNPGTSKTVIVKYNDYNRKTVVDPRSFLSADINLSKNTITIQNHNFTNGQKLIYTSASPSGGLVNNGTYYAIVFDENTIKLSTSYYNSTNIIPQEVDITTASGGTLSPINPPIESYRDSLLIFDLSDSSLSYTNGSQRYSAFDLKFYRDSNYTELFDSSFVENTFEVQKFGKVGIDTNAFVSLKINSNIPEKLFYRLEPISSQFLPFEKNESRIDDLVVSNNQIQVRDSIYNGKHRIVSTSSTSFAYSLAEKPESSYYGSSVKYETDSLNAFGAISKVDITSNGQNYYSLPYFDRVISNFGTGAILESNSSSIGNIKKTKINDIGFGYPTDFTLKPSVSVPQILKVEPLNSLEYIGITSVGRGYTVAPKLILIDGKSNEVLPEVDLRYSLGDTNVTILKNTFRLNDTTPTIIPTQNSNGVGISSVQYNSTNKEVTVTLSVGFSTISSFPFSVGDEILVENISVGINSTGKGFNSADYNYKLFTITSVDQNIGGIGTVSYSLNGIISNEDFPGTYDDINSSGRIIPKKYFPSFDIKLKNNNFFENEEIRYLNDSQNLGFVLGWDENTKYLRVSSKKVIENGKTIEGVTSKTNGSISSAVNFESYLNLSPYSKVENGWTNEVGYLSDNLQRIQDNFYYQNFSYSLRSKVPYDTWEDAVGSLNHTAGFKKFSDYQLETNQSCGISTNISSRVDVTVDIDGVANLNCIYDFDLVRENALVINSRVFSDEITFSSRILTDYFESVGNRVLSIDDISGLFNSNPRSTKYSVVHRFLLSDARSQKYITYTKDRRYNEQRQLLIFTLLHDNNVGYLNQYGRVESSYDIGSFDFTVQDNEGLILFYPTKYRINDFNVTTLSYNIKDIISGIGSTNLGGIVQIDTNTIAVSSGSTTIVGLGTTFTSSKLLIEITDENGNYQFDEINLVHNNTDVQLVEYGQLINNSGIGTYNAYISESQVVVDFIPNVSLASTVNVLQLSLANNSFSGIGTFDLKYARIEAKSTSIGSTSSPIETIIAEYPNNYDGGYFIIQVSDTTNNRHQISEVVLVDDENDVYLTEFGIVQTDFSLGSIGAAKTTNSTQLTFTPLPDIDIDIKVYFNSLNILDPSNTIKNYNNSLIVSDYGIYYGTERDVKREFVLKHKNTPIFKKYFDGSNSSVVSVASSTINIPNHFFVTGEKVSYSYEDELQIGSPIGIGTTYFGVGIGTTDKLPSSVYIIKVDENNIRLSRSAEEALKLIPIPLNITSVGTGSSHSFTSVNQNTKALIAIDNVIQSPIVSTSTTTLLSSNLSSSSDILYCDSVNNLYIGNFIKIDDEVMKIESVGFGSTNSIRVIRPWFGTKFADHSSGSLVTKISGNYNIVDTSIHFADAPYGNVPIGTSTNPPNERDWDYISTRSHFQGRTFMRSGVTDTTNETYYKNYLFDDISSGFNGIGKTFTLLSNGSSLGEDISTQNGVILINDIFQGPGIQNNYTISESGGSNSITFVGTATSLASDINTSNLPSGGIIVSIGSTEGFGYQPLIGAGGTAIVSIAGTISSISIGNSGSGYRSYIQKLNGIKPVITRVGVATSTIGTPNIEFIGTAVVTNGSIVSIAITNPGSGYSQSNPPYVVIDEPISYSNIPLIYNSTSSGIGTQATVDIIVGQGSSIINFELKNTGYGYKPGDILTLPIGGIVGIPTISTSSFSEFKISVESIFNDKFSGWTFGELLSLDKIESLFDGNRKVFPLKYLGQLTSIYARKGSTINVQDALIVFVNDILQAPGEGYIFKGGSKIEFSEAPKVEDTCKILFYRGSGEGVDVVFKDIIEPVKIGDSVTIGYDSSLGQPSYLQEDPRVVSDILSLDAVETNPYFGPGNTPDSTLTRPANLCYQTEDKIINELEVPKDRSLYEPLINPSSYLIKTVGIGSTIIFVDNIRPFFNPINENNVSLDFQKNIKLISQDSKVGASATAIVSVAGTISSIEIVDGGFGYANVPSISIQNPVGIGTTYSVATASISSGIVTSINLLSSLSGYSTSNPPKILIEPPTPNVEENKVSSYYGDSGIIVGFGITTISSIDKVIFDFYIPGDSYLRDSSIVGTAITISTINTEDYFIVYNSNVGSSTTSIASVDKNNIIIGIATNFYDNVYQVDTIEEIQKNIIGIGTTYVKRVYAKIAGLSTSLFDSDLIRFDSDLYTFDSLSFGYSGEYTGIISSSNYFGNFSWGKIYLKQRSSSETFNFYGLNGISGITTSSYVVRSFPLKNNNYI